MNRRLAAEALGTALLLVAVVGSGIMAERLAGGNLALALLANALATGAALVVLITVLGPLSGAHFNPCVTLYQTMRRQMPWREAAAYIVTQFLAATLGVWLAHAMFALPVLETSAHLRDGPAQWLAEGIATFGLLLTIAGGARFSPAAVPMLVGLYITGAIGSPRQPPSPIPPSPWRAAGRTVLPASRRDRRRASSWRNSWRPFLLGGFFLGCLRPRAVKGSVKIDRGSLTCPRLRPDMTELIRRTTCPMASVKLFSPPLS